MKRSESDSSDGEYGDPYVASPKMGKRRGGGAQHRFNLGLDDDYMLLRDEDSAGPGEASLSNSSERVRTVAAEIHSLTKVLREPLPLAASEIDSEEKEVHKYF